MRYDGLRQILQIHPLQVRALQRLLGAGLPRPRIAGKEEVHALVDRGAVLVSALHDDQGHQVLGADGDAKFFTRLSDCRLVKALPGLNVTSGTTGPVSVHEAGAVPVLEKYLPTVSRPPTQDDIDRGHEGVARRAGWVARCRIQRHAVHGSQTPGGVGASSDRSSGRRDPPVARGRPPRDPASPPRWASVSRRGAPRSGRDPPATRTRRSASPSAGPWPR